jgi:hypothetical protein
MADCEGEAEGNEDAKEERATCMARFGNGCGGCSLLVGGDGRLSACRARGAGENVGGGTSTDTEYRACRARRQALGR